jgi:SpoVK/Ycf46/Vps4 family AAA+-type ATPase
MDENNNFINFLDGYLNKEELTKNDYTILLKEIDNNYLSNKLNILDNKEKNIQALIENLSKTQMTNIIEDLSSTHKDKSTTDVSLRNKRNQIYELLKEYNYIKKYKNKKIKKTKTKKKDIICNIDSISDLIEITDQYEYDEETEYNIDLECLHNIKDELKQLNDMIGLKNIKTAILDQLLYFMQKLHLTSNDYKHMILYGPPGTGKTEVAKILGKMYSKIGILSKRIFKKATRSDLVAGYLGQTAIKTESLIKECLGGVLFIDEAYSLGHEDKSGDSYSKECLDTLCEALSYYKEDLIVIIAGYEKELDETIFKTNVGLKSRFIWRFEMDPYDHEELFNIFKLMIKTISWSLNEKITNEWFKDKKDTFESYGRDMESLVTHVKISHGRRIYGVTEGNKTELSIEDMDAGYKRFIKNKKKKDDKSFLNDIYI